MLINHIRKKDLQYFCCMNFLDSFIYFLMLFKTRLHSSNSGTQLFGGNIQTKDRSSNQNIALSHDILYGLCSQPSYGGKSCEAQNVVTTYQKWYFFPCIEWNPVEVKICKMSLQICNQFVTMVEQLLRTVEPGLALVPYNLLENTVKQVKIITVFPLIVALRAKTNF